MRVIESRSELQALADSERAAGKRIAFVPTLGAIHEGHQDVAESTLSPPQSTSIRCSKLPAPGSNGFVGYGDATLREKIFDIAEAQREPMVQPNGMADHLEWKTMGRSKASKGVTSS